MYVRHACDNHIVLTDSEVRLFNDHTYSMFDLFTVVSIDFGGLKQRLRPDTLLKELIVNDISLVQETKCDEADEEEIGNECA